MAQNDDIIDIDQQDTGAAAAAAPFIGESTGDDPDVRDGENGTRIMKLHFPPTVRFRRGGQETKEVIAELIFRRMNGGDMVAVDNFQNDGEKARQLFARLTGQPVQVFDQLDVADIDRGTKIIDGFLPQSLKTGKTSSAQ